ADFLRTYRYRDNIGPYVPQDAIETDLLNNPEFAGVFATTFLESLANIDLSRFGTTKYTDADPGLPQPLTWGRLQLREVRAGRVCRERLFHRRAGDPAERLPQSLDRVTNRADGRGHPRQERPGRRVRADVHAEGVDRVCERVQPADQVIVVVVRALGRLRRNL